MNDKEKIVETILSVDRANQVVVESMKEFPFTNKEKLEEAEKLLKEGFTLILNSIS